MTNHARLLLLAAIWGSSFLFMRIAANPLGAAVLIEMRVSFAAVTLLLVSWYLKKHLCFRQHTRHYFILGLFNSALPFVLFAYAAQTLDVSTLAILNATAPIWAAIISAIWTRELMSRKVNLGLLLGLIGVAVLVGNDAINLSDTMMLPIVAAILAACSYGFATNYAKNAPKVDSFNNAHGSMWASVILVLPLMFFIPARETMNFSILSAVVALGVICTGFAYLLYFRLIADLGPSSALPVTFLIPIFGIIWGYLFLGESIGLNTLVGTIFVIMGTMLVTGFSFNAIKPKWLIKA